MADIIKKIKSGDMVEKIAELTVEELEMVITYAADKYYNTSKNKKQIINSVEGIIRQIIGWREYMHFMYFLYGDKILTNFKQLKLDKKLPNSYCRIHIFSWTNICRYSSR